MRNSTELAVKFQAVNFRESEFCGTISKFLKRSQEILCNSCRVSIDVVDQE